MPAKLTSIPPLVNRGTPLGINAIPSGTIYLGQFVKIVGFGTDGPGDYGYSSGKEVPIVQAVQASDITSGSLTSGTTLKVMGVAMYGAPHQSQYVTAPFGNPLTTPTDITLYQTNTITDVRRVAVITPNDNVQLWLPFSGTSAPSAGDFLTLSSGVDGCVSVADDPQNQFTIGIVQGYVSGSHLANVTVSGISSYVLTTLDFKY